jgi:hypothetical protein
MHSFEAGSLASGNFLKRFDTDGSPIVIGQTTLTSKGTVPKEYQTPYGATTVARQVYQSSRGGEDVLPTGEGGTDCYQCNTAIGDATTLTSMPRQVH